MSTEIIDHAALSTRVDGVTITLNPQLVAEQGIGLPDIRRLLTSHEEKHALFQRMRDAPAEDLPRLAREVDGLEYHQQGLWRFPLDARFHMWYDVPRCTCAKGINAAMRGHVGTRALRVDCPVHGEFVRDRGVSRPPGGSKVCFRTAARFGSQDMLIVIPGNHVVVDISPTPEAASVLLYETR